MQRRSRGPGRESGDAHPAQDQTKVPPNCSGCQSEEKVRRAMAEAQRLASLAPGEWRLWIDRATERLGVPRATLDGLVSAIIKDSERKAREDKAEARRQEERVRREQHERKREQQKA